MPTLYITDLDGTLLRSDATLSAFSRSVLTDLLSRGVLFTVASARSVTSIRSIRIRSSCGLGFLFIFRNSLWLVYDSHTDFLMYSPIYILN